MKLWVKNTILAVILVLIIAVPLLFMGGHEFGGSDDQASDAISEYFKTSVFNVGACYLHMGKQLFGKRIYCAYYAVSYYFYRKNIV